tara:strand:+ start:434 stop:688 length:255 start_codon:yes stop_codon:yes gene_type:complete
MAKETSEFTQAVLAVIEEVAAAKDVANKSDPVPVMMERMTMSEGRKQFEKMGEFERQMFLDNNGQEKLLEMARGKSEFNMAEIA